MWLGVEPHCIEGAELWTSPLDEAWLVARSRAGSLILEGASLGQSSWSQCFGWNFAGSRGGARKGNLILSRGRSPKV